MRRQIHNEGTARTEPGQASGVSWHTGGAPLMRAICSICSGGMDASMDAMPSIAAGSIGGCRGAECPMDLASLVGAATAAAVLAEGAAAGAGADLPA